MLYNDPKTDAPPNINIICKSCYKVILQMKTKTIKSKLLLCVNICLQNIYATLFIIRLLT